jgi:glutathione S-transferase
LASRADDQGAPSIAFSIMLKLYNFPQSTCSQKVRLTLWEKELEFLDRPLNSAAREHLTDWYLQLNPNGVVPTLDHDGAIVIDSSVIMEYLDEVFPERSLTPSDPLGRAKMRKWMRYFEEVATPSIRVPSFNQYLSKRFDKLTQEEFDRFVDAHPIRKQFYKRMRKEAGFDARDTEAALDRLRQTALRMEQGLAQSGGPYLMGSALTLADYCIVPTIDRMADLGLGDSWNDLPRFRHWLELMQSRPAFAKTFYRLTRLSEIYDGADYGSQENSATVTTD